MAAGTTQVTPVGITPGRDIFNIIGEKVKKAKDQAIEARQEADERIKEIEETPEEDITQEDIVELESLKQKRSTNGYFFKKALKFQATDKIRTTMGKFQRDPELKNDPAATEKERFYAKSGMFRPGEMPDMSDREEKNKDVLSYVGKGFQMIMDAIDKVKSKVNRTAESSEKTSRTASSTESTTENVSKSTENLSNSTENIANTSKSEVNVQQMELNFEQDAETKREQAAAEARSEGQSDVAGTSDVIETDQGVKKRGGGLFSSLLDIGGDIARRRRFGRFGRRMGNRMPGAGRARLGRMRAGRMMNPARRNTQYTAPIGPQPMNSPTPWASQGGGFTPRMESNTINLSQGGIIAPIKPKKQQKLAEGGITGLISKFLPPPLGPMLNMMLNPGGAMGGIGNAVKGAAGGAFQMLTNPTKLIGDGLRAVLPMNRGVGKDIVGGDKSEIENMTKIFQLPTLVGGGIMFASIAQIANAIPFLGAIINASKPIIKPILDAFGLPASVLGMIFGGGAANAATMPANFGGDGGGGDGDGGAGGDGGGGAGGADLGASMRSGETIQAQASNDSGGFIQGGSGKGSEGGQNTSAGYATHYHLSPPSNDANGWAQARAVALTSARMMLQRGSTVYFGNIKQYADPSKLEQQIAAEQKAHTQPGRTQGGIDMQEKSSDGNMRLKFPLKVTNVTQDISGGSGRTARVMGTNVRLAHGASGSANSIESSVAPKPSQSAAAPSVNPDTTRPGARANGYGGSDGGRTGSSSTLSNVANIARTANNIITNPVGTALEGLGSFYPSLNR